MCFSTTASFVAGSVLTVMGVAALKKRQNNRLLMLAAVPLIFAVQQFSEGFVWILLSQPTDPALQKVFINTFLLFALVMWPGWVSTAIYLIEEKGKRRTILGVIACTGIALSCISAYYLAAYDSRAWLTPYHVHYQLSIPEGYRFLTIVYLVPTIISLFVSGNRKVNLMGVLISASYIISMVFFKDNVLSVWCFFSAAISVLVYFVVAKKSVPETRQTRIPFPD